MVSLVLIYDSISENIFKWNTEHFITNDITIMRLLFIMIFAAATLRN